MNIIELKKAIADKKLEIEGMQQVIENFEYSATESEYDDFLDEVDLGCEIAGLFFTPSQILKKCDPIAYRCGKSDFESEKDLEDVEEYQDLLAELAGLEEELEDLETEIFNADDYQSVPEDFK